MRILAGLVIAAACAVPAVAQDTTPKTIPLEGVKWAGPPVTLENLKGKNVAVLVYATWCPKCNVWSGELLSQMKQAVQGKPTVLLAINADDSPGEAEKYVKDRGFIAPNILHGYDPAMPAKLGFNSNLFYYVMVGPDGTITDRGQAGSYYGDEQAKEYVVAKALLRPRKPGKFKFMTEGMSDPVSAVLWPLELGQGNDAAVSRTRSGLNDGQKKELDGAVEAFMEAGLREVQEDSQGSLDRRFVAYEKAAHLAAVFKTAPQNKTAREVLVSLEKDETFKKELAAKKAYDAVLQKPPAARKNLFKAVAKRYEGTQYGAKAGDE